MNSSLLSEAQQFLLQGQYQDQAGDRRSAIANYAVVAALCSQLDQALHFLKLGIQQLNPQMPWSCPFDYAGLAEEAAAFKPLWQNPEFHALLQKAQAACNHADTAGSSPGIGSTSRLQ